MYISSTSNQLYLFSLNMPTKADRSHYGNANINNIEFIGSTDYDFRPDDNQIWNYDVNGGLRSWQHLYEINNWPDYVFSKQYELTPLIEVENYIKLHGHLSEIPSQEAMEKNGMAVAEILTLQMKKIEELTLYIIELQKQQVLLEKKVIGLIKN